MLLHAQQVMLPYGTICGVEMVKPLTLYGNSRYLLDDPRIILNCNTLSISCLWFVRRGH